MRATIDDVASYFRYKLGQSEGSSLTPLKLQKLSYYAQAWSLVLLGRPLFCEEFEAWAHGPVNRNLYVQYADYGWNNIEPIERDSWTDLFTADELDVLNEIWEIYGDFDAKYLEKLTHDEEPWIEARHGLPEGAYCDSIIRQDTMKKFYTELMHRVEAQA